MTTPDQTNMQPETIKRDGEPPLKFTGERIGFDSTRDHNSTRWTTVEIYRTKGGKFVVAVASKTCWQGERDYTKARSFATAAEVMEYLKGDESGRFSSVAQGALDDAAKAAPEFAAVYVETVD